MSIRIPNPLCILARAATVLMMYLSLGLYAALADAADLERHGSFPWASPDGKHIVFASSRDTVVPPGKEHWFHMHIYSMNTDGSNIRQLTHSSTADTAPVWSPDGKWIVFGSMNTKGREATLEATLEAMHPDGSARHTLMSGHFYPWVRISPDSRRVIFTSTDANGERCSISTLNMDGSGQQPLTTGLDNAWDGIWSPDGKRMVFAKRPSDVDDKLATTESDVYIADADGSNRRLLATFPGFIQVPSWSPDGRSIAYQTYTGEKREADVVVLDVATGKFRTVSRRDRVYLDETPSWLPNGSLLLQSTRDGRFEVYAMNADGSDARALTK